MRRTEQRLQRVIDARLEPDETFVAWTRAWVSRYRRLHWLLSLRNRDFAVVTDRRLMLWSAGFFTRWPRRRVLAERLDEVTVESTSRDPGRRMACSRPGRRPLLLELGKDPRSDQFSIELRDRADAAARLARNAPAAPPPLVPDLLPDVAPEPPPPLVEGGVFFTTEPVIPPPAADADGEARSGDSEQEPEPSPEQPVAPKRHRPWG